MYRNIEHEYKKSYVLIKLVMFSAVYK